eukprot:jgi/Ulvmu1/1724/UM117_0001.1
MFSKPILAGTAVLALASQAMASNPHGYKVRESSASCSITSASAARSKSAEVGAAAFASVSEYFCGAGAIPGPCTGHRPAPWHAPYARAVVDVTSDCQAYGNAGYSVNGGSYASAQATAIAKAFATAISDSANCETDCKARGKAMVESIEKILLSATASIEVAFDDRADGGEVEQYYNLVAESVEKVTVIAVARAMADAYADEDSCSGKVKAKTKAGDKEDPNTAECSLDINAYESYVATDALAAAIADASAKVCLNKATTGPFEVEAEAIAEAMAIATIDLSGSCFVQGRGKGCLEADAEITATAEAVAVAFAKGYASSTSKCFVKCHMEESSLSVAISSVLAEATVDAMEHQCTRNYFTLADTKRYIVTKTSSAIAKVLVDATASSFHGCSAVANTSTEITPPILTTPAKTTNKSGNKKSGGSKKTNRRNKKNGSKNNKRGGNKRNGGKRRARSQASSPPSRRSPAAVAASPACVARPSPPPAAAAPTAATKLRLLL